MIYEPQPYFNVQLALGEAFIAALARAAVDYVIGQNKPWAYYLGYGFGGAALATGIPNANAILYVIGSGTVKLAFEKSPGAAEARLFLDGVAEADLDLSDEAISLAEYLFNIPDDGLQHTISVLNLGTNAIHAGPTDWLAILQIETSLNSQPKEKEPVSMAYDTIVFRYKDAEADTKESSVPVNIPSGATVAQIQTYVDSIGPLIDTLTQSLCTGVSVTLNLTIPAALKDSVVAGALNERGGLITFDTSGPRAASFRIPAIDRTLMPGSEFSLEDNDVANLITALTTATTAASIRPRTEQDYNYVTARKGSKSLRK